MRRGRLGRYLCEYCCRNKRHADLLYVLFCVLSPLMLNFSPTALLTGHFHAPGVPCFPAAPVARGRAKRPMVIFSHGLGGNRSMYAEHGAAYAAQVSGKGWW